MVKSLDRSSYMGKCKPSFDAPSVFPQSDAYPREATLMAFLSRFLRMAKCASRRFVLDATAIAALKAEAAANSTSSSSVQNPTRVEVVTALIWKCIANVFAVNTESTDDGKREQRPTLITHAVNLHRRAVPPFSENCMGNFIFPAAATLCSSNAQEIELSSLVIRMRLAIKKLDGNIVQSLQGDGGVTKMCELSKEMGDTFSQTTSDVPWTTYVLPAGATLVCTTLILAGGKPTWTSWVGANNAPQSVFMNTVVVTDTRFGDGVEAWIYLSEEEMAILEHDDSFLDFASIDHGPLELGNSVCHPDRLVLAEKYFITNNYYRIVPEQAIKSTEAPVNKPHIRGKKMSRTPNFTC